MYTAHGIATMSGHGGHAVHRLRERVLSQPVYCTAPTVTHGE